VAERAGPGGARRARAPLVSTPEAAHRAALDLLSRRSHFEVELDRKLTQKGFAPDHVRDAIARLRRSKLVDDRRSALEFITSRLRRSPQGRRRLRAELARKGIAKEVIEAALQEALPGDEADLAREAARRFQRRRSADPRALERHLDRLGFSTRDILALSEELPDLQPPDDDGC
jgi:regulatory protein